MALPSDKYTSNDYFLHNPTWDQEDSPWKAEFVVNLLKTVALASLDSICEVGCGAGGVLAKLRDSYPEVKLYGYDIAPDTERFWKNHEELNIRFRVGDFFTLHERTYDVMLVLDVIEHVANPFSFLSKLRHTATYYIFHVPLALSALTVTRETPLLHSRRKVGHIHYFTKNLALYLLEECGFEVMTWRYSGSTFNSPRRTWKTKFASFPRWVLYHINKDWGVRVLGGETLFVLAKDSLTGIKSR